MHKAGVAKSYDCPCRRNLALEKDCECSYGSVKMPPFIRPGLTAFILLSCLTAVPAVHAQALGATKLTPNLEENIDRPLRYRPEGADFVIENGPEFFNRSLYGGNTAFRVDGGDKPEFILYLPGRGGNLRFAVRSAGGVKWLHDAAKIVTRYRPGELIYEIHDPLLGETGALTLAALAYHQTEGLIVRVDATGIGSGLELIWAYGGANGQRGTRDGDIGTERVPISEYFQLLPEFCRDNSFELSRDTFTLHAKPATIVGLAPDGARLGLGDATHWNDLPSLLAESPGTPPTLPVTIGRVALQANQPLFLSFQRTAKDATAAEELSTYREVSMDRTGINRAPAKLSLAPAFSNTDLPKLFGETERYFTALRNRVAIETPDPFLNAAVGALNVAADAVWDAPENAIMHGAIAWRTKLLGWRGPYLLDALGWHDRARAHFTYWAGRQNTDPISTVVPPPDEATNLARNEAGLHTNGDLSNSHYDMNLVFIDALFRHLRWTGDVGFAKKMWPVIERHLAWERRLFRREFGPEKLPLYEAYAVIWASDDLQYSGGGTAHASAYNYWHNKMAAQIAPLVGADPTPYEREAELIARGMRELLWMPERGMFAENKDWLGLQRVHPHAALWTFYHTMDSEVPTANEASRMSRYVDTYIPHLPVRGPGVPPGLHTLATSDWMPYDWSINNVVLAEAVHGALGLWQAGHADEAWNLTKGSLTAAMFMGISPGNVGSMSYLDVYRRESQRDFADGSGVLSRALIEGLFGVRPDAIAGELTIAPGFPQEWDHATLHHPDIDLAYRREHREENFQIKSRLQNSSRLKLEVSARGNSARVWINDVEVASGWIDDRDSVRRLQFSGILNPQQNSVKISWSGPEPESKEHKLIPINSLPETNRPSVGSNPETVDLTSYFNDRVTRIFQNDYRAPRSPFVSLAMPKQGIGGWAGGVKTTAEIDDTGLRAIAGKNNGRITLPNGLPFATPGLGEAKNILFTSQWDNYPREATIVLSGKASAIHLLMAGSTNAMQSRIDNGEVIVTYRDGQTARLTLENPTTWWPIEQDYFIDDFQFRRPGLLPVRVDLKTGVVRVLEEKSFKGHGGKIPGGAATVLGLSLDPNRELASLTIRTLSNDVVIGLMAVTLDR